MRILADIATGETAWADVFFLIAIILFVVVAVIEFMARSLAAGILAVGLALVALGFLVL